MVSYANINGKAHLLISNAYTYRVTSYDVIKSSYHFLNDICWYGDGRALQMILTQRGTSTDMQYDVIDRDIDLDFDLRIFMARVMSKFPS